MSSIKRILIIGPAWIGDMVMAQTLYQIIRQRHPEAIIDVLAPAHSGPLIACMPEINQLIPLPIGHGELKLKVRYEIAQQLKKTGYDVAYVLTNSFKSALIPWLAGIPRRIGWIGECRWGLLTDAYKLNKIRLPLMIQRFAALELGEKNLNDLEMDVLPWPKFSVDLAARQTILTQFGLSLDKPILVLCPGAEFGPAKRWPAAYYAEVANARLEQGWQVWIVGSPKEKADAEAIQSHTHQRCVDLCGKTQLAQAIALMSCASAVVSNDSGLMHIAAALERPLIAVYGSSSPGFTPPLAKQVKIVSLGLSCSPCFKRECPLVHLNCLNQLSASMVLDALTELGI